MKYIFFPRRTLIPLVVSILILNWYFVFISHSYIFTYYIIWLGGFGYFFIKFRERLVARFAQWKASQVTKFIILGYTAVLVEEFIVAFVHSWTEGFSLLGFGNFILQFWAFNILAFTGLIIGLYFLLSRYYYSAFGLFILIGGWGLFSEHILTFLKTNTLAAILLILPTMSTYSLVMAPAVACLSTSGEKNMSWWIKYPYSFFILFIFSIIPILILGFLRGYIPEVFPACSYIPCA